MHSAIVCLAGPVAETIAMGVDVAELLQDDAIGRTDHEMAKRYLAHMSPDNFGWALAGAAFLVRERWVLIERVADALLTRGRLDAREVETLFRA